MAVKTRSRTTNTIINFASSIGGQLISVAVNFVVRTVFIKTLGKDYLGIDGLFANILQMLSLAEFGVGSAIIFKLYEPIAQGNHQRITQLMNFYKTMYRIIGCIVLAIGLLLIPFLPLLINGYDDLANLGINAILVFTLYLMQTVSSYWFFAYKNAIISANQKEYIITFVGYLFTVCSAIVRIVTLLFIGRFEVYVTIAIVAVIGQNFVCARIAQKMYPYISDSVEEKVGKEEFKSTIKDCGALFLYKLNTVVLKATDNIVISACIGLGAVASYSNYYILYTTINTFIYKIFNAVAHSLGNLHTTKDTKREYSVFESVMLICAVLGGTMGVCIAAVSDELIQAWIGDEWMIASPFAILMGVEMFSMPYKSALSKYRSTMGLFQQAKFRPVAGMIINLMLSIILVQFWGICGVLLGTIVADWSTLLWFDPIIVHKHGFNNEFPVKKYFIKFILNFATVVIVGAFDIIICSNFWGGHGWLSVIVHGCICGITVPAALLAVNARRQEGKYIFRLITKVFRRKSGVK